MFIRVDCNILICVIVIVIIFAKEIRYYTKRYFDSIEEYNRLVVDKMNSYSKNKKQYNKNIEESGIRTKKRNSIVYIIVKIWKLIRSSE